MIRISAIIPTIGRAESLVALLDSMLIQSKRPDEVLVADGSAGTEITALLGQAKWSEQGLTISHLRVDPPNAVRQRKNAIAAAKGDYLFMLDDDIVLETDCLKQMADLLAQRPELSAVTADFSNQTWPNPTTLWRWYIRLFHGVKTGEWQGRVIGPLLRFGYNLSPKEPVPMQWLGAGNSLIRRSAYEAVGGFSDFFLHRCTMNEDVDLGLKLSRHGPILLHPKARLAHHHAPGGRVSVAVAAEDDIFNRYMVLRQTCRFCRLRAWLYTAIYALVESFSNLLGALRRWRFEGFVPRTSGRLKGLARTLHQADATNLRS